MAKAQPKYDKMTADELALEAGKRDVPDAPAFRKTELKRVLKALDKGDKATVETLTAHVKARSAQQQANADRVLKKAQESVTGAVPEPTETPENAASTAKGIVEKALAETKANAYKQKIKAMAGSLVPQGATSEEVVRRMLDRADKLSASGAPLAPPKENAAERACRLAGIKPGGPSAPPPIRYEVMHDCTYYAGHGSYQIHKGAIVSASTHNIQALLDQDVELRVVKSVHLSVTEMGVVKQHVVPELEAKEA